jgi:hypothetical protein
VFNIAQHFGTVFCTVTTCKEKLEQQLHIVPSCFLGVGLLCMTFAGGHRVPHYFVPPCLICGTQVSLETCKIDEYGQAVHEECYVDQLVPHGHTPLRNKSTSQVKPREFRRPALAATVIQVRVKRLPTRMPRWSVDVALVAATLAITFWIAHSNRRPASPLVTSNASNRQAAPAVATPRVARPAFKRIQVDRKEVDYIADDVTIRHFTDDPASQRMPLGYKQINFGEDVTVRYFAPNPVAKIAQPVDRTVPSENSVSRNLAR